MKSFFTELQKRNATLYYFGWLMFTGFFISFIVSFFDKTIIPGISAWIKPMKFFAERIQYFQNLFVVD